MNAQVIAVVNQKGGTGKSTTCANLGVGLAQSGKKVLVVDVDPQASLSISLSHSQPDDLPVTLSDLMGKVLNDQPIAPGEGILHHAESVDLMPSNIQLSGMEVSLVNAMSRETILRQYLDTVRKQYTHTGRKDHAMKRPLAYITAAWSGSEIENAETAARYCRQVYDAGYSPICPLLLTARFLHDAVPQEHKDGLDIARDYLRRSRVLVVCGRSIDETVKNDIATAERLRITATTLDGILTVKGQGRGDSNSR